MFVWRIENSERLGPYVGGFAFSYKNICLCDKLKHPAPYWSKDRGINKKTRFGFKTYKELINWFSDDDIPVLQHLKKAGYRIVLYEVKKAFVQDQPRHCSFDYEKARKVGYHENVTKKLLHQEVKNDI